MPQFGAQLSRISSGVTRRALKLGPFGYALSVYTNAVGLTAFSRRMSKHTAFVPKTVPFEVVSSDGDRVLGQMHNAEGNDYIVRSIWLHGLPHYEAPLPQLFMRLMHEAQCLLDVGANSGLYAVIAGLAEPNAEIHSFEPFPPARHWLEANIELNDLREHVTIVPAAVGAEEGTAQLYVPAKKFGDTLETSASLDKTFRAEHSSVIDVAVVTLDEYVKRNSIGRVSVLRADVEGAEHLVLAGAQEILRSHRPIVFVEVLSQKAADLLEPLRAQSDYRAVSLEPDCLVELPAVLHDEKQSNQLWYPPERRGEILNVAEDLKIDVRQRRMS